MYNEDGGTTFLRNSDTFYQASQDYVLEDSNFKFKVKCFALLNALNSSHIYLQTCIANNVATST